MASDIIYSVKVDKGIKNWGVAWKKSLAFLCQPRAMLSVAKGYRYYINKYVPKDTGALRKSARPKYKIGGEASAGGNGTGSATVYWGDTKKTAKYAHYQFVGNVYAPSKPVFSGGGIHTGWVSPKGKKKYLSTPARKLGDNTPRTYVVHTGLVKTPAGYKTIKGNFDVTVKGYTTKGTGYDWITRFKNDKGDFGETAVNIRAGRYLYEMFCIKSGTKLAGGRHVYHSWNQIKNRVG